MHVLARADNGVTSYSTEVKVRSKLKSSSEEKGKSNAYRTAVRRCSLGHAAIDPSREGLQTASHQQQSARL